MSKTECLEQLQGRYEELNGKIKRASRHCTKTLKDNTAQGSKRVDQARSFAVTVRNFLGQAVHAAGSADSYLSQIDREIAAMETILRRQPVGVPVP